MKFRKMTKILMSCELKYLSSLFTKRNVKVEINTNEIKRRGTGYQNQDNSILEKSEINVSKKKKDF